jgi:hypothetical protein
MQLHHFLSGMRGDRNNGNSNCNNNNSMDKEQTHRHSGEDEEQIALTSLTQQAAA